MNDNDPCHDVLYNNFDTGINLVGPILSYNASLNFKARTKQLK